MYSYITASNFNLINYLIRSETGLAISLLYHQNEVPHLYRYKESKVYEHNNSPAQHSKQRPENTGHLTVTLNLRFQ